MKKWFWIAGIGILCILTAVLSRPGSRGVQLRRAAAEYTRALESGRTAEALEMMTPETAEGLCGEFLLRLEGVEAPSGFVFDGTDARGTRMAGRTEDSGTRVLWFSAQGELRVVHDTALDNILGNAVLLCRASAAEDPSGNCPVSGEAYIFDPSTGTVTCPRGHLGEGLTVVSDGCSLQRDTVAAELASYIEAGYLWPGSLEEMFTVSSGEFGRRGGYRCPDNGYKYYELRDGAVYCPFHEESTPVTAAE